MSKKLFFLIIILVTVLFLSGCSGLPKTAQLSISIDPNPVPYDPMDDNWPFAIIIGENNGVGVFITSFRWDEYDEESKIIYTAYLFEANEESITSFLGSNYLQLFSILQGDTGYSVVPEYEFADYIEITVKGIDDNSNPVEAIVRVDLMPK